MRKNGPAGIFAFVTVALILQAGGATAGDASSRTNEYDLMSLLIQEQYGSEFSMLLIDRDTESSCLGEPLGFLKEEWPDLKAETLDSLVVSYRSAPRRFIENFKLPVEYRLVSDDEYMKVLRVNAKSSGKRTLQAAAGDAGNGMRVYPAIDAVTEPDWNNFDTVFPDAQGYLIFSRVAFDAKRTQALLVFCNAYRCNGTRTRPQTREIAFFTQKNGVWDLVATSRGVKTIE